MKNNQSNIQIATSDSLQSEYAKPRFRLIKLAAEEVLSTGCKVGGICDIPSPPPGVDAFAPGS